MNVRILVTTALTLLAAQPALGNEPTMDQEFESLGEQYIEQFTAFSPVGATGLGDHRFDDRLDDVGAPSRARQIEWTRDFLKRVRQVDTGRLTPDNQVDHALLRHALESRIWRLTELREWSWNPLLYSGLAGNSIHGLMARDFAPVRDRLNHVAARLLQFPRFLEQVRQTLIVARVPLLHAKTAEAQNRGILTIIDELVRPHMEVLTEDERERLLDAIEVAEAAISEHQDWLQTELLPNAQGDARLGIELYEKKLALTLHSSLTRQEIHDLGLQRVEQLHQQMYEIAKEFYREQYPLTRFPDRPSEPFRRAVIRFGLEKAYAEAPRAS